MNLWRFEQYILPLLLLVVLLVEPTFTLALLISISVHEFAHAWCASGLGDSTAKFSGRLTLNPLAHLDFLGTLSLVLFRFGWGKPVPFNPLNLRNPRRDAALISLSGPLANLILAVIFSLIFRFFPWSFLIVWCQLNLVLGLFNLLPLQPLDGFKIVLGILPTRLAVDWLGLEALGPYVLLFLILSGLLGQTLLPLTAMLGGLLLGMG